jgi:hypothetical protein
MNRCPGPRLFFLGARAAAEKGGLLLAVWLAFDFGLWAPPSTQQCENGHSFFRERGVQLANVRAPNATTSGRSLFRNFNWLRAVAEADGRRTTSIVPLTAKKAS